MVRNKIQQSDHELLDELGLVQEEEKKAGYSPEEERVIAGFEEINRFIGTHSRLPSDFSSASVQSMQDDVFESLLAIRLGRLRKLVKYHPLLQNYDRYHLLDTPDPTETLAALDDEALLTALGIEGASDEGRENADSITTLKHVRSQAERQAAEEIADRESCKDFEVFKPVFEQVRQDLKTGIRESRSFGKEAGIQKGDFFILKGVTVYVAHIGETIKAPNGENDARLRLIYANGTESNLLRRSLQRALYKDETARRITSPSSGPLFEAYAEPDDQKTGIIYVLRSLSEEPYIAKNRNIIHKIGVTTGSVKQRVANARHDATYLLAPVEIIAEYELFNINPKKLEQLLHRILASARIDLGIKDRFGQNIEPREWFLVPLNIIQEIVEAITQNRFSENIVYSPEKGTLIMEEEQ